MCMYNVQCTVYTVHCTSYNVLLIQEIYIPTLYYYSNTGLLLLTRPHHTYIITFGVALPAGTMYPGIKYRVRYTL